MERRAALKTIAIGFVTASLMAAVRTETTAAQSNQGSNETGDNDMLDAQTLADRYVAVWNENDEGRRRTAIAELWVPDGQHYVQSRAARGYDELEKRVRGSHEKNVKENGNRFRAARDARHLRDVVTFHWEMLPSDGETVLARGLEFLIIRDDGKILVDYQFVPA